MAKSSVYKIIRRWKPKASKRTSIGKSKNSKPLNKYKRKGWKKYRGQGK